jgi:hypothetical protein
MKKLLFIILMLSFVVLNITLTSAQSSMTTVATSKSTTPSVTTLKVKEALAKLPIEDTTKNNEKIIELSINIIGTIIGGLLFTLILFLLNEYIFRKNNLTGEWETAIEIDKTSYNPFKDLKIEYKLHLLQKEYELVGSGEKINETKPGGVKTTYLRKNRITNTVDGYYERKYLGKSTVYLNVNEKGRTRDTRATFVLTFKDKNNLEGTFISTAADASGKVKMKKS